MNNIDLKSNTTYSESEIVDLIKKANPYASSVKIKWILFDFKKTNKITQIGIKKYVPNGNTYSFDMTELSNSIEYSIQTSFPDVEFIIWESSQLNEWMNFLLSKSIIFVEVENDLRDYIFSFIQEKYGENQIVLLNPSIDVLSRYIDSHPIVVKSLFSRSPKSKEAHKISLEKILVDIFSDKLLSSMIGTNDKEEIAKGIIKNYSINRTKALAYAKRRKCQDEIKYYLEEKYDR